MKQISSQYIKINGLKITNISKTQVIVQVIEQFVHSITDHTETLVPSRRDGKMPAQRVGINML